MKHLLYLGFALAIAGCSATKASTAKAAVPAATTAAKEETPTQNNELQLRIKNKSKLLITNVTVVNGSDESFVFTNISAGATSGYQPVSSLCSCGYNIGITYKIEDRMYSTMRDCVNMMPCKDYYKGKLTIEIIGTDPEANEVQLKFVQD